MEQNKYNEKKQEFDLLYNKLYNENFSTFEELRKIGAESFKKVAIIVGIIMVLFFVNIVVGMLSLALFIIYLIKGKSKKNTDSKHEDVMEYLPIYKENIIRPILNCAIGNCEYFPNGEMSELEYSKAEWERFDTYKSNDKIVINLEDNIKNNSVLTLADVHTTKLKTDKNGNRRKETIFWGLAGYTKLPRSINCNIRIILDYKDLGNRLEEKIDMDMSEFENNFNVYTNDKIKATQLLTSDVMSHLTSLLNSNKAKFEIFIENEMLYIRFHTGAMFEPSLFGESINYQELERCFDIMLEINNVTNYIINSIINTEL